MADRLAELLRQRALLQEHLDWLEREIAAAKPAPGASPVLAVAVKPSTSVGHPIVTPLPPSAAAAPGGANADVDATFDEYRVRPEVVKQDVRKGCLLYFVGAFVLLGLGVLGLYFALRHD